MSKQVIRITEICRFDPLGHSKVTQQAYLDGKHYMTESGSYNTAAIIGRGIILAAGCEPFISYHYNLYLDYIGVKVVSEYIKGKSYYVVLEVK